MALNRSNVQVKKDGGLRTGYGFSSNELKEAGVTTVEANKLFIPVDKRRKSSHPFNIEELKKLKK